MADIFQDLSGDKLPNKAVEEANRVVFTHGRGIWIAAWGAWIGLIVFAITWFWPVPAEMDIAVRTLILVPGVAVLVLAWSTLLRMIKYRPGQPIVVVYDHPDRLIVSDDVLTFSAEEIENCIVGEDEGLKRSRFWIKLRDRQDPLLVMEKGSEWHNSVIRQVRRLADRWHVGVDVRFHDREWRGLPKLGSIGVLLGVILIWLAGYPAYKQAILITWPSAEATVLTYDAGVRSDVEKGNEPLIMSPAVTYEYVVEGETHRSSSENPWVISYISRSAIERDFAGISPGSRTRCYYNPAHPEECYLINIGVTSGPVAICVLGCLLILHSVVTMKKT